MLYKPFRPAPSLRLAHRGQGGNSHVPHLLQVPEVALQGLPERTVHVVPDPKLLAGLHNDGSDLRIVAVAHPREEVVDGLVIQPPTRLIKHLYILSNVALHQKNYLKLFFLLDFYY